ncbi:MAG TPA: Pvc16 family protein [Allosphingosinicella sp.]|jgi:hypothetical protein
MPHGNLFGVTATLKELLRVNIWRISTQEVTVSDLPPEEAEKMSGTRLNLHLYHAAEDPSRRNEIPRGDSAPFPISRTPMPLTLYYALTAHSAGNDGPNPAQSQFLMGLGMKSLHDFPVIDDSLMLPGPPDWTPVAILDVGMRGAQNRITIVQRQLSPEDSVTFWAAAQHHTARLTAYYEVRSSLLLPEPETEKSPLVAAVALGAMPSPRPTLISSSSIQTMKLPALSGGTSLSNPVAPAVAALGAIAAPAGNRVTATGEGLGDGSDAKVLLGGGALAGEAVIDPTFNPDWHFQFAGDSLAFDVLPEVAAEVPGGFSTLSIRPGLYSLAVRREKVLKTQSGATSIGPMESNRIPFAVGPALESSAVVAGRIRLELQDGVDCTDPLNIPQLAIGGDVYRFVTTFPPDPAKHPGTFIALSDAVYEAHPFFDPADGGTRMVRLAVNGVDAAPFWLEP